MRDSCSRIGLGTAQIGMPYGVTNTAGMPGMAEAERILICALENGIDLFDTAHGYGGGESERRLGRFLPADYGRIVTKLPPLPPSVAKPEIADFVRMSFRQSLRRLGRKRVYGLLGHRVGDFSDSENASALFEAMQSLKEEGKVAKIGISVYEAQEIDAILETFPMDLIQLPLSVFDQRLLHSGHLSALHEKNVEVHARSIFLQGLLLTRASNLPQAVAKNERLLTDYHAFLDERKISPLHAALGFVLGIEEVDHVVVGVTCASEMNGIIDACREMPTSVSALRRFAAIDPAFLNPSRWNLS